ncbi:complement C3-like, partial [Clarias magur]
IPYSKDSFSDDPLEKQYVYLQAQFPSALLEKVVLLSFQSGYIFVQTDKGIYTPGTPVYYRIFSLTPDLQPVGQTGGIYAEILNPQGIAISRETYFPKQGAISGIYHIPEVAKPGIWSLVTRFKNIRQKNFTAEFEVKEYVLPSFEVALKPSKAFLYVDDQELQVDITAKDLNGKNVDGVAFVAFGIMRDDTKIPLSASLKREQIINGAGRAVLSREIIQESFPNIADLVGSSVYVLVSVLTESGSEIVEAERRGIKIVTSPYTIQFKRTPKFFKPGMPFYVTVHVTYLDQSPAENVDVVVMPGNVRGRTKSNGMAKVAVNTQGGDRTLRITAKTRAPDMLPEKQAMNQMTAQAYTTKGGSNNYLHISVDALEQAIGDHMNIDLNFKSNVRDQDFTYLILTKGQIVKGERFKRQGQPVVTLSLPITKNLVPSFRVVAYYHIGSSEVVSDSIWVDVKDTCMGTLKLDVKESLHDKKVFEPGDEVQLIVTGDPKARVGLVAVDKAVFGLNKNRLTQTKIWDIIEKHDTGCTAGSGKDSMGVFYDAGLLFQSDKAGGTTERTVPDCSNPPKRIKRGFLDDNDDKEYINADEIVIRTQFHESWLWEYIDLPACPGNVLCESTSHTLNINFLKDSITTWQVQAISLSKTHGICVADPYEITVAKDFSVDLKLPYSAVRNEQLEVKAILHNFSNRQQKVRVEFFETEHVCSIASKKKKYRTIVTIDAKSTRAVPYVIIPMELGNHQIEVQAASDKLYDGVRKVLKVVGNVRGKDAAASLTAFVLIVLQEGGHVCATLVKGLPESSRKATEYLERRLPSLTNPYAVAMSSYALANAGKLNKEHLLQASSEDGAYWDVDGVNRFSLEATAYALLALVKAKEFEKAGKVVHWLSMQNYSYGSHESTQATIIVFQALAEYYKQVKNHQNMDLDVEVSVSGRSRPIKWSFNKDNAYLTRTDKVQLKKEINVTAKGSGAGILK